MHAPSSGVDWDFGKGSNTLNIHNGDPEHHPNPCVGAIDTPPFYSVAVYPTDLTTSAGLKTDADARVLDRERCPITDLYACGNDMASVM
jgi:3-oxosteroid 1-dehydrogenase